MNRADLIDAARAAAATAPPLNDRQAHRVARILSGAFQAPHPDGPTDRAVRPV